VLIYWAYNGCISFKKISYKILSEPKMPFKIQEWFILMLTFKNKSKKDFIKSFFYPDKSAYPGEKRLDIHDKKVPIHHTF